MPNSKKCKTYLTYIAPSQQKFIVLGEVEEGQEFVNIALLGFANCLFPHIISRQDFEICEQGGTVELTVELSINNI